MHRLVAIVAILCCLLVASPAAWAQNTTALRMIIVRDAQQAERIRRQLRQGASFSALAGQYSIGPERSAWGYSGTVRLRDVQPELRKTLRTLQPGEVSDVLELGRQYAIVKAISPRIEQHYEAADRALDHKQPDQAIRELQAALRLEKDNVQAYIKLGMLYDSVSRFEEAISYLDRAQGYAPWSIQILLLRGAVYTRAAMAKNSKAYARKALQAYEQVLQNSSSFAPAAHFGIGKVYSVVLKQPETAIPHLEQAVRVTSTVPQVYGLLIQAYYDIRRYQKAWEYLRLAQSQGIEFPKLRKALLKARRGNRR
jgi:tetratricopeptide (TPR) repeat protein